MSFFARFLLPLVKGGSLHVGRPLGPRALAALTARAARNPRDAPPGADESSDIEAIAELARYRLARARALLPGVAAPPLDAGALRLGITVHNLLALGHPAIAGHEAREQRIVAATQPMADLGPPPTAEEAVRRHSLLSRLGEITRTEHTVESWAGRRQFVGRPPPPHVLALPALRRVSTTSLRRLWFKEIGVPAAARGLWVTLHRASPLAEALDPLRLDPPLAWDRILPVLRFPTLCRVVVGRVLELGLESAGGALVAALQRFAAAREGASPSAIAFAIRLLAHAYWLHHLFGDGEELSPASELAALLVAAHETDLRLVWPPDVSPDGAAGRAFVHRLALLRAGVHERSPERHAVARGLCRLAAESQAVVRGGYDQGSP